MLAGVLMEDAVQATGAYEVGPIGPDPERLTGRRFKFANQHDAALFKLFFPTVI